MSIESYHPSYKKAVHIIFAENLKRARATKGWTQESAASRLGVKRSTYQAYEEARAAPPVHSLLLLAKVFGIDDLLSFLRSPGADEQVTPDKESGFIPGSLLEKRYQEAGIREKLAVNILLGLVDLE